VNKSAGQAFDSFYRTTHGGGGCGCFAAGCGFVGLLLVTVCVGSFFVAMHTSLPLAWIEAALEEDGDVQIEGLRGSISSGIEIDSLKFRSDPPAEEWNELRDLRFSWNGFFNFVSTKRLLISEASVGGATIYAELEDEGVAGDVDFDGASIAEEIAEEWNDLQNEFRDNDSDELRELRIDLLSARNVVIVDPLSGRKMEFEKVEFRNYQMLRGRIRRLGDLEIRSNQLDLVSDKSERFSGESAAWQLTGQIKPPIHEALITEMPFEVDFAIAGDNEYRLHVQLCDGQVVIDEPYGDTRQFRLQDFSPASYFRMPGELVPSGWHASFRVTRREFEVPAPLETAANEDGRPVDQAEPSDTPPPGTDAPPTEPPPAEPPPAPPAPPAETPPEEAAGQTSPAEQGQAQGGEPEVGGRTQETPQPPTRKPRMVRKTTWTITLEPDASFMLGDTRFQVQPGQMVLGPEPDQRQPEFLMATAEVDGNPVTARIRLSGRPPWYTVQLDGGKMPVRDLWSRLFFGTDYEALDADQKLEVERSMALTE
jgi:hypothetical protein